MDSSLKAYWPDWTQVDNCIRAMAESDDSLVLLAAHKPMTLRRQSLGKDKQSEIKVEQDLLNAFLEKTQDGFMLLPITGESGMGKSHMIRWLDANLNLLPDCNKKYHIVRIPKGVSMREILKLILENIEGDEFARLRSEIDGAVDEQDEENIKQVLRAHLLTELHHVHRKLIAKRDDENLRLSGREQNELFLSGEGMLRAYINDNVLSEIFMKGEGCLSQLAKSHMHGSKVDEPKSQFTIDDLKINDIDKIKDASSITRLAFQYLNDRNLWKESVDLLNSIIDKALSPLTTVGSKSIVELFIDIRKALFKKNKELILLIEDFSALAGMQEIILDISIRESDRIGEITQLCGMRTAIAMTSDYLTNRDTINTRAVYEWIVEEKLVESNSFDSFTILVEQVVDFCGRYINAARHDLLGLKELKSSSDDEKWVTPYTNNNLTIKGDELLLAFGLTKDQYHLFPLSRESIAGLVQLYLYDTSTRTYKFNPRTIINMILRKTLHHQRDCFFNGTFPSSDFPYGQFPVDIENEIYKKSNLEHKRLSRFLWYWGGKPNSLEEVYIPKIVFDELQLPFLGTGTGKSDGVYLIDSKKDYSAKTSEPAVNLGTNDSNTQVKPKVNGNSPLPKEFIKWKKVLDEWLVPDGKLATSTEANYIRKTIYQALAENVDLTTENLIPMKEFESKLFDKIYLATARSNPKESEAIFVLINEKQLNDESNPKLRFSVYHFLLASIKYNYIGGKSWNYNDGPSDYILYASFLNQVTPILIDNYKNWCKEKIRVNIGSLFINSTLLGNMTGQTNSKVLQGCFSDEFVQEDIDSNEESWGGLRRECFRNQEILQSIARKIYGLFQGGGEQLFGLDVESFIENIDEKFKLLWEIPGNEPLFNNGQESIIHHCNSLRNTRRLNQALNERIKSLRSVNDVYISLAGNESKSDICDEISDILTSFNESGLKVQGTSIDKIIGVISEYKKLALMECLSQLKILLFSDESMPKKVQAASLIQKGILNKATQCLMLIEQYLKRIEEKMTEVEEAHIAVDNVEVEVSRAINSLIDITQSLTFNELEEEDASSDYF